MSSTRSHNVANFGPLTAGICWRVWGTPANFNGFRVLPSLLHTSLIGGQPNFARIWLSPGLLRYYTFSGAIPPDRILPGAKFTLHPSLAFSYIGSVTARQSTSGERRQPNFAAWYKEWNYRTFAPRFGRAAIMLGIGSHSSYGRPA